MKKRVVKPTVVTPFAANMHFQILQKYGKSYIVNNKYFHSKDSIVSIHYLVLSKSTVPPLLPVWQFESDGCSLLSAPLSSLIPTTPPLQAHWLSRGPAMVHLQWAALETQTLITALITPCCTMGTCSLVLTPSPDKTCKHLHRHTHTYTQMHLMPLSVSLFIPEGSLSLVQGLGDQVSMVLCLLFCTGVQRRALSLYTSIFFFLISLHSPYLLPLCNVIIQFFTTLLLILPCYDGEYVPLYVFPFGQVQPGHFCLQTTKGQQWMVAAWDKTWAKTHLSFSLSPCCL